MDDFQFVGGDLTLDFLNTVADRLAEPRERLATGADVDRWARGAGLLGPRESLHLGPRAVARVRQVREDLYEIVRPLALGRAPAAAALARFNGALVRYARARELAAAAADRLEWRWTAKAGDPARLLAPILIRAAELLTGGPSSRLRQCADAHCGWIFLDRSRAGQRRWCRMDDCGNRAKARRHYQRGRRANLPPLG